MDRRTFFAAMASAAAAPSLGLTKLAPTVRGLATLSVFATVGPYVDRTRLQISVYHVKDGKEVEELFDVVRSFTIVSDLRCIYLGYERSVKEEDFLDDPAPYLDECADECEWYVTRAMRGTIDGLVQRLSLLCPGDGLDFIVHRADNIFRWSDRKLTVVERKT